jgi:hypothetical protein
MGSPPLAEIRARLSLLIDNLPQFGTVEGLPRIFAAFFTGLLTDVFFKRLSSPILTSPSFAHQSHILETMHLSYSHQAIFEPGCVNALLAYNGHITY